MTEKIIHLEDLFFEVVANCWLAIKNKGKSYIAEKGFDLTFEQFIILSVLEKEEGVNLRILAQKADRDRTSITRMLDGLEKRNLVVRIGDKNDNRQKLVYLTKNGRKLVEDMGCHKEEFIKFFFEGLSRDKMKITIDFVKQVTDRVNKS